jgi:hypothetical protein
VDKRRILLLGATGYTGQRVLRELLARGEQPTLVGRTRSKMLALADRLEADLPVAEVEVTSTADLARLLEPGDVVLSTVGPFLQLGMATVTAAAQAGAHYLDSAGEGSFVRRVFELDAVAAARGATVVPAFGYDYVPGNLAGALALTRAGERARRIEVGYFLTRSGHGEELRYRSTLRDAFTLTTGGTRTTLVGAAAEDAFAYRRPHPGAPARLVEERTGKRVHSFGYAGRNRAALTVAGSEHLGLPEAFPELDSVDVCLGWFGRWTRPLRTATTLTAPLLRSATARAAVTRLSQRLPRVQSRTRHRRPIPGHRRRPRHFRSTPGHHRPHRARSLPADRIPPGLGRRPRGGAPGRPHPRRPRPSRRLRARHPQARRRPGRTPPSRRAVTPPSISGYVRHRRWPAAEAPGGRPLAGLRR